MLGPSYANTSTAVFLGQAARRDQNWPSWRDEDRNAYPTTTTLTINGLDEGVEYKVRVRARMDQNTASPWSGPWSQATQTVSAPPAGAPASPAGLAVTLDYGAPVLSWDDPADDSITGYRIRRGPRANDLPALVNDTGSVTNTYTDDTAQAGHATFTPFRLSTTPAPADIPARLASRLPRVPTTCLRW